ncbi:MAG: tetratricopeptide repeat protein [Geobacteraceae bacterium]|nr:tetratricopeptide repeat protein [Geobacteraceae bacterium]
MNIRKDAAVNVALITGITCFLVFLRSVACDFIDYDDARFVIHNSGIRTLDFQMIITALTHQFSDDYWAPLTWISFAIDYHFWGLNPTGYHLVNIVIHAVNAGLVVLLADRLLKDRWESPAEGYRYPAMLFFAGLFWAIHPLRVESVTWVSERKDVLYGMLALGSILCYLKDAQTEETGSRRYYLLSLILFLLALMAKPTSVFVPMLLLVADWYPLCRFHKGRFVKVLAEKVPFFVLAAMTTWLTIFNMSLTSAPYAYAQFSFSDRLVVSGYSIVEFCRLFFYPIGIHIFNTIAPVLADPVPAYARTVIVLAVIGFALCINKRKPSVTAVCLAFLIPLLPTLPFFQVGVDVAYSPRHSYLPSVVPTIVLVFILFQVFGKIPGITKRTLAYALLAAVSISFIGMTEHLISSWKNAGTVWTRVIELNPVGRAYSYRGLYFMENRYYSAAADDFRMAADKAVQAGNPEAFKYVAMSGGAFIKAELYREAVETFSVAIRLNPRPVYYYHRGLAQKRLGKLQEAEEDFRSAGQERGEIEY